MSRSRISNSTSKRRRLGGRSGFGQGSNRRGISCFAKHRRRVHAPETGRHPRAALARHRRGMGVHGNGKVRTTVIAPNGQPQPTCSSRAISGTSPRGMATHCKISEMRRRISFWASTTGIFRSLGPSASPIGWRERRRRCRSAIWDFQRRPNGLPEQRALHSSRQNCPERGPEPYLAGDMETSQSAHKFRLAQYASDQFSGRLGADRHARRSFRSKPR